MHTHTHYSKFRYSVYYMRLFEHVKPLKLIANMHNNQ